MKRSSRLSSTRWSIRKTKVDENQRHASVVSAIEVALHNSRDMRYKHPESFDGSADTMLY